MKTTRSFLFFAIVFCILLSGCTAFHAKKEGDENMKNVISSSSNNDNNGENDALLFPIERYFHLSDFTDIHVGMTVDELYERLGEPSLYMGFGICHNRYIIEDGWAIDIWFWTADNTCSEIQIIAPDGRVFTQKDQNEK
jgi:hypothetical protein